MMDAMRRVKDRAKAGIVNVPKGSATRAKHGMAKSVKDLRKEKEEKESQRLDNQRLAELASVLKSQKQQFDVTQLDDFLEKEDHGFTLFGDYDDDEDEIAQTTKYEDDDGSIGRFSSMHPTREVETVLGFFASLSVALHRHRRAVSIRIFRTSYGAWYVVDFFVDIYFYVDMVFNFFTAYWEASTARR